LFHGKIGLDVGMNIEQYVQKYSTSNGCAVFESKTSTCQNSMGWVPLKDLSIEKSSWLGML
jgi:hypothetical protein